jgi:hypothetical protein
MLKVVVNISNPVTVLQIRFTVGVARVTALNALNIIQVMVGNY